MDKPAWRLKDTIPTQQQIGNLSWGIPHYLQASKKKVGWTYDQLKKESFKYFIQMTKQRV